MKTFLVSALATAGLVLSVSSAFAISNSPQGQVIIGGQLPAYSDHESPTEARFLSGRIDAQRSYEDQPQQALGLSSNAIEGREFLAVQKGGHWLHDESGE
jgi:hypothetical protein